ncbi:MAG TPA: hydrogenase maturation nickel metallochaperone HypA [Pirellulales bacterium]|jgi:hydrogenase nickel insertion protein HypA|nr:hydrogenase maturation nickel metallochaperone HypA [Pirellulales bacterium]
MHEASLVRTLIEQVDRLASEHAATAVDEVRVRIGPLSGVEPYLVAAAFERFAPAGATLVIDEVPLTARCRGCGESFEVESFRFRCPRCDSADVEVIEGDGFMLESITIRRVEPLEAAS